MSDATHISFHAAKYYNNFLYDNALGNASLLLYVAIGMFRIVSILHASSNIISTPVAIFTKLTNNYINISIKYICQ